MDENHQDKTEGKAPATEGKSPLSPLSSQDQREPARTRNNQMEDIIKHLRDRGYKVTEEYNDTGLSKVSGEHPQRKTLWDWGQLLIIPLLIVLLGIGFSGAQYVASFQIAKDNRTQDLRIARDTQEEATLKAYLDDMTTLLLDKKLRSQAAVDKAASVEAAVIAQAKTLTALRRLTDPDRKSILVRFLSGAGLIEGKQVIIGLGGTDLSGTDLSNIDLNHADFSKATLRGALLSNALLSGVDLFHADLTNADLSNANLSGAHLNDTHLSGVDLSNADLSGALLIGALLSGVDLSGAFLFNADLSAALLSGVDLFNAYLTNADLTNADLSGAQNLTQQQLDQARICKGATLPKGLTCNRNQ